MGLAFFMRADFRALLTVEAAKDQLRRLLVKQARCR
jgi:hypothetical protein